MRCAKTLTGLLALLLAAGACSQSGRVAGETLYASRCAFCHGEDGRGDGPAGISMHPPPPDMTTPAFWQDKTSEALGKAILQGSSGTAMPGYEGTLDAKQLAALVSYLERFRPGAPAGTR